MSAHDKSPELPAEPTRSLAEMPSSASLIANTNQDEIDWNFFAGKFEAKYGFVPHRRDSGHQEYYHWFTVGAHAEFMGRLNGAQNHLFNRSRGFITNKQ
jgi:hypothetical protein